MIRTRVVDGVRVITMEDDENRFDRPFVQALDQAVRSAAEDPAPLVLTGAGRFFSNGLHLEWVAGVSADEAAATMGDLHRLLARLLVFPGGTVAALNGHAFGAGALLAAAADWRVMREDRGYLCFPDVDLGLVMSDQFDALLQAKFAPAALVEALLSGARLTAPGALALGFVDRLAGETQLLTEAVGMLGDLVAKDGVTVGGLKAKLFAPALDRLTREA